MIDLDQYLNDDDRKILYEYRWSHNHDAIKGLMIMFHIKIENELNRDKINSIRKKLEGASCQK